MQLQEAGCQRDALCGLKVERGIEVILFAIDVPTHETVAILYGTVGICYYRDGHLSAIINNLFGKLSSNQCITILIDKLHSMRCIDRCRSRSLLTFSSQHIVARVGAKQGEVADVDGLILANGTIIESSICIYRYDVVLRLAGNHNLIIVQLDIIIIVKYLILSCDATYNDWFLGNVEIFTCRFQLIVTTRIINNGNGSSTCLCSILGADSVLTGRNDGLAVLHRDLWDNLLTRIGIFTCHCHRRSNNLAP